MKRSLIMLHLLFVFLPFGSYGAEFSVTPVPQWVKAMNFAYPQAVPADAVNEGIYYLLVDRQALVDPHEPAVYRQIVKKILTEQGLEAASQVFITFDPSYEKLNLHHVDIYRDGRPINQLQPDKITVFQRETDLERRLYNGRKTASIILEGTLVGDVIAIAYTVTGQHPLFAGKFMDAADMASSVPLRQVYYRWVVPRNTPLDTRLYNTGEKLTVEKKSGNTEYVMALNDVAPVLSDGSLPEWYYPYPWIQASQFRSWQEVARWETDFYPAVQNVSRELAAKIETIRAEAATDRQIIERALCSVQREIRYLGIEIGTGSHQPTDPSIIFRRKFGDCKDKVYLLCTILGRLGIYARPALVNTSTGRKVGDNLPSSFVFDHVIARVEDGSGNVYWLDPTGECQEVSLDKQYQALYGKVLVLDETTAGLTDTGSISLSVPETAVNEHFDLSAGVGQPALMTIKTRYRGRKADEMRFEIESSGIQQTSKNYINYYASDYPSVAEHRPMKIEDDPEKNLYTITEYYRISDFWKKDEEIGQQTCAFHPNEFYSLVQKPKTVLRSMPLGISHPRYITQRTTVALPEAWDIEEERFRVENDALRFEYSIAYSNNTLTLDYAYRTKTDFVNPEKAGTYLADLDTIYNEIGYQLYYSDGQAVTDDGSGALDRYSIGVAALGFILAVAVFFAVQRYDPLPREADPGIPGPSSMVEGIGGWLVIVAIGLILTPIMVAVGFMEWLPDFFLKGYWSNVTANAVPGFDQLARGLVTVEFIFNIVIIATAIAVTVQFFKKRASFPSLYIALRVIFCLFLTLDIIALEYLFTNLEIDKSESYVELGRTVFSSLIWCSYMIRSKRVRNTFVRRRITPQIERDALDGRETAGPMPPPLR